MKQKIIDNDSKMERPVNRGGSLESQVSVLVEMRFLGWNHTFSLDLRVEPHSRETLKPME